MTDSDRIADLERRVAELEKQRSPDLPTYKYGGDVRAPIIIPIRTDEVTCDFNPPSLDHNPTR